MTIAAQQRLRHPVEKVAGIQPPHTRYGL